MRISWETILFTQQAQSALTKQYSGCAFSPSDVHPHIVFGLHLTINFLFISKSIINPVIFALRQRLVRRNLVRFLRCRDERTEIWKERQLSFTRYSFISNRAQWIIMINKKRIYKGYLYLFLTLTAVLFYLTYWLLYLTRFSFIRYIGWFI